MPMTAAPLYTLYVSNGGQHPFTKDQAKHLTDTVTARFPSFTLLEAQGMYERQPLPTILVQIATHDRASVETLCAEIGRIFNQRWIGLGDGSTYSSVPTEA